MNKRASVSKREIKKLVREMIDELDVNELQALFETTTVDYCIRRLKECVVVGEMNKIYLFFVLYRLHQEEHNKAIKALEKTGSLSVNVSATNDIQTVG
jgi:hypothetical protein